MHDAIVVNDGQSGKNLLEIFDPVDEWDEPPKKMVGKGTVFHELHFNNHAFSNLMLSDDLNDIFVGAETLEIRFELWLE